jgi:hypothetical protein
MNQSQLDSSISEAIFTPDRLLPGAPRSGFSDLGEHLPIKVAYFAASTPNALFRNSTICCRASYPCHGSGLGRPYKPIASGP